MSILDDIKDSLEGLEEIQPQAEPSPPAYSLQEQITLGEERRTGKLNDLCPMCNMEMGEMKRARLRAGERSWVTCSVGCSLMMFKRQVTNPRETSSIIEALVPSSHKHP